MAYTPPGETREKVYRFIRDRLLAGSPPTVREVQEAMGFGAVESARKQLDALVAEGRLVKTPGRSRSYRLPGAPAGLATRVPIVGRIRAGNLDAALEDPDGFVVFETRVPPEELFALRVRGDSMKGVGILDGDVLIVRQQADAETGSVVVAMVDGDATVKTLRRRRNRVHLEPANPAYDVIVPEPGSLRILGRVLEVRRTL